MEDENNEFRLDGATVYYIYLNHYCFHFFPMKVITALLEP